MGGKQLGFSDYELTTAKKQTKREKFSSEMVAVARKTQPMLVKGQEKNPTRKK